MKFDGWPWKTIGLLSLPTSSYMYHFIIICEFTLELQSGNAQSGSNSMIFRAVWPWNLTNRLKKTMGHLFYATSSFVQHFVPNSGFKLELQSANAQSGSNSTIFSAVYMCILSSCFKIIFLHLWIQCFHLLFYFIDPRLECYMAMKQTSLWPPFSYVAGWTKDEAVWLSLTDLGYYFDEYQNFNKFNDKIRKYLNE